MAKVLEIQGKRRHLTAKKGFEPWVHRFGESYGDETSIGDLSDDTLRTLIQSGESSSLPLYELVMGITGMGAGARFYFLDNKDKIAVMDIALFLLDQLRFEAMKRLGWIEDDPLLHAPLVDLVQGFSDRYSSARHHTPSLSPQHPRYEEFQKAFEGDRAAFIRKLIPDALQIFGKPDDETLEPL